MPIVTTERNGAHLVATMDDRATRNAMTEPLLIELEAVFDDVEADHTIRTLILRGANGAFCAGANLKGVSGPETGDRKDLAWSMNQRGGRFFARLNALPSVVIAIIDGPAFGGGFGIACCADIVLCTARARFALSETSLGLVPAQIAPYVVGRLGLRLARRLALTGQRFDGEKAVDLGLADAVRETEAYLQPILTAILTDIGRCAPRANRATKALLQSVGRLSADAFIDKAADVFTAALRGDEGAEGVAAFTAKRPANWVEVP